MCRRRRVDADHPYGGLVARSRGATVAMIVSSTITAHRFFSTRPAPELVLDAVIATAALAGSLLLISHDGIPGSAADADLEGLGILLAMCASAPLVAWRRSPLGVFTVTAAASALLAGLGYPLGIPLGASAAVYLLAASRDERHPWTRRTTAAASVSSPRSKTSRSSSTPERRASPSRSGRRKRDPGSSRSGLDVW